MVNIKRKEKQRRHNLVQRRWYLATLLHYNPQLRVLRKNFFMERYKNQTADTEKGENELEKKTVPKNIPPLVSICPNLNRFNIFSRSHSGT